MSLEVGDKVTRMLAGTIPMELKIAAIDDKFIYCGPEPEEGVEPRLYPGWKFDKTFGYEVDEDLGWGVEGVAPDGGVITGSYLVIPD